MRRIACIAAALALGSVPPAAGDTELVLIDGRVLSGVEARREGAEYVLRLESGDEVTLPAELVERVRIVDRIERHEAPEPIRTDLEPGIIAGQEIPAGPSGLREGGELRALAGEPFAPPSRSEQTAALGPPARFQKGIVDSRWTPTSDWDMNPENNDFNPSTWAEGPIDPTWVPQSAFDQDRDVLESSRSTWAKSIIDSSWKPTDGFGR